MPRCRAGIRLKRVCVTMRAMLACLGDLVGTRPLVQERADSVNYGSCWARRSNRQTESASAYSRVNFRIKAMNHLSINKLQRVALKEVWPNEARDFTPWLQENIAELSDALDISLSTPEREQSTGSFKVDLLAEDRSGDPVVIENQLEPSDHDHLGKLLTYLVAFEAKTAIWIVKEPRSEHVNAVSWLNESTNASFYLVKVEAVRIGDSRPAALFTVINGPSEASKVIGKTKKDWVERHYLREAFWGQLLERAKKRTKLHANISPTDDSSIVTTSGTRGIFYVYFIRQRDAEVGIWIDLGRNTEEETAAAFENLKVHQTEIERDFGGELVWNRVEGRKACRIGNVLPHGGYRDDQERWPEIQDAMIDAMIRIEGAVGPRLKKLDL